jgi:hypothetical protein
MFMALPGIAGKAGCPTAIVAVSGHPLAGLTRALLRAPARLRKSLHMLPSFKTDLGPPGNGLDDLAAAGAQSQLR